MNLFSNFGSIFDKNTWEDTRSKLHHDDYHYRFYHYLGKSSDDSEMAFVKGVAAVLAGTSRNLPASAEKAFRHWVGISISLIDLFKRAPREAIQDSDALLAHLALVEIGRGEIPASVAANVRERAESAQAKCRERNEGIVEKVIEESRRLVKAMDEFVVLASNSNHRLPVEESERRVRAFLEDCRRLDRALSDIPRRLHNESGA